MKTSISLTSVLIYLFVIPSFGQVTITANDYSFHTQDSIEFIVADPSGFSVPTSGANQIWDYSNLIMSSKEGVSMGPNVSISPVAGSFPDANVIFSGSGSEAFYKKSNNKLEVVGSYFKSSTPPFPITYTNYLTEREFPFTYGSSFTDTSVSNYVSGGVATNSTVYVSSDIVGYGELKIPGATYQNVLMDKLISVQQIVSSSTLNANSERYSFYCLKIAFNIRKT